MNVKKKRMSILILFCSLSLSYMKELCGFAWYFGFLSQGLKWSIGKGRNVKEIIPPPPSQCDTRKYGNIFVGGLESNLQIQDTCILISSVTGLVGMWAYDMLSQ